MAATETVILTAEFDRSEATEQKIMEAATQGAVVK